MGKSLNGSGDLFMKKVKMVLTILFDLAIGSAFMYAFGYAFFFFCEKILGPIISYIRSYDDVSSIINAIFMFIVVVVALCCAANFLYGIGKGIRIACERFIKSRTNNIESKEDD